MKYSLDKIYPKEYEIINRLFNPEYIKYNMERINTIYRKTEKLWSEYLNNIPNRKVKYLLIAEAPPWNESGEVLYVLNPKSNPRSLLSPICKAFFNDNIYKEIGIKTALQKLANTGFLIIDSIPYALEYKGKRNRKNYKELVKSSCSSYLIKKINGSKINWDKDLKIAFSLLKTARHIIDKFQDGIYIKSLNKSINIDTDNVAVTNAYYPDYNKLKILFNLR